MGEFWQQEISSFQIWEKFRKVSKHIRIETFRKDLPSEILSWDKNIINNIELSVIFPMYNVEKYLDQCLLSITKCKDEYMDFLFINDGSTDNSRDIVLKWKAKDSRIKLIDKENGGCASARQKGLESAQGKYIGFVDPDDFIDETMFHSLLKRAMEGCYEISYCGYNEYYENTKESRFAEDCIGYPYFNGVTDIKKIWELIGYCRVAIWRGIYKKDLLKRANIHFYEDLKRFDDLPFKVETFANARSVVSVPQYLYYYRLDRIGQDVSANDERLYVHFDIFKHLNDSIACKKNQELIDWLQICKLQTHKYAIRKIKRKFLWQYCKYACKDLNSTGSFFKTCLLLSEKLGKKAMIFYVFLKLRILFFFINK